MTSLVVTDAQYLEPAVVHVCMSNILEVARCGRGSRNSRVRYMRTVLKTVFKYCVDRTA